MHTHTQQQQQTPQFTTHPKFSWRRCKHGVEVQRASRYQSKCPYASQHNIDDRPDVEVLEVEQRNLGAAIRHDKVAVPLKAKRLVSFIEFTELAGRGGAMCLVGVGCGDSHKLEHVACRRPELHRDVCGVEHKARGVVEVQPADQVVVKRVEVPADSRVVETIEVRLVKKQAGGAALPILKVQEQVSRILHTRWEDLLREVVTRLHRVVMCNGTVASVRYFAPVVLQRVGADWGCVVRVVEVNGSTGGRVLDVLIFQPLAGTTRATPVLRVR